MPLRVQTYEEAIRFLFGRIDFERMDPPPARAFKLDRMASLLAMLGNPQEQIPAVHIAGTKGKGSTAAMIAGVLTSAGYRTGLFTSPHLTAFEERMRVDGTMPAPHEVVDLVNRLVEPVEALDASSKTSRPTFFEITTAMAWLYFLDHGADIAVLEVGVGGRLDSTNLCRPAVTVITNVSRDHTGLLGNTIAQIAREKAGIIKSGVPVISGATGDAAGVVEGVARGQESPLFRLGNEIRVTAEGADSPERDQRTFCVGTPWSTWSGVDTPLRGEHQRANAAVAIAALDALRQEGWAIPERAVREGLSRVQWPCRIELVGASPTVVLDAAHNWASARALADTVRHEFAARRRILILAATRDKDIAGLLRQLLPTFDTVILTQYKTNPRFVAVEHLQRLVRAISDRPVHVIADPVLAWEAANRFATPDDLICVAGSFFIVAELRDLILASKRASATKTAPAGEVSDECVVESISRFS